MNQLLVANGAAPMAEAAIGRLVGDGAATLVARAFAAAGCQPPSDALDRFLAIYNDHLLDHTRPYPGIPDVLDALRPRAALAVLTNKPLGATRRVLAGLDLARFFPDDRIIGGDGPFARKPDPAGLRHLMAQASATPAETTLVGDSIIDWRTAHNAATSVCLVRYGFGFEGFPIGELHGSEAVVDSPEALIDTL